MTARILVAALLLAAPLLASCDGTTPPLPTPTATPLTLAPDSFVLRGSQLPDYQRAESVAVSPDSFAETENDQSLIPRLRSEGLQTGARVTYQQPQTGVPTQFASVVTEALFFDAPDGAIQFVADESARRNRTDAGTVTALANLPADGMDQVVAYDAEVPAGDGGTPPPTRGLIAVLRRGRVVAELFGSGLATTATLDNFLPLLTAQETLLQRPPEAVTTVP